MNPPFLPLLLAAAVGLVAAGCEPQPGTPPPEDPPRPKTVLAAAEAPGAAGLPGAASLEPAEASFLVQSARDTMAAVQAARVVARKSGHPKVRAYARRLQRELGEVSEALQGMADARGVALLEPQSGEGYRALEALDGLQRSRLDWAFMQEFGVDARQRDIVRYEWQSREGLDPELQGFVETTLPRLREQLQAGVAVARQLHLDPREADATG